MKSKSFFALLLATILLPLGGLASVLSDKWLEADIGALKDAAAAINARIIELASADIQAAVETDSMVFEGKGSSVLTLPRMEKLPLLIRFSTNKKDLIQIETTGSAGGYWGADFFLDHSLERVDLFAPKLLSVGNEVGELTLLITAKQSWKITFLNAPEAGGMDFSGAGIAVGGLFSIPKGGVFPVTVTYDASKYKYDQLVAVLHFKRDGYWDSRQLISDTFSGKERKGSIDVLIEIPEAENCFYVVHAGPKTTWSIVVGS